MAFGRLSVQMGTNETICTLAVVAAGLVHGLLFRTRDKARAVVACTLVLTPDSGPRVTLAIELRPAPGVNSPQSRQIHSRQPAPEPIESMIQIGTDVSCT